MLGDCYVTCGVLGEGGFSKVKLCTSAQHEGAFALKCCRKRQIVRLRQTTHVQYERDIVACLVHPFILRMHATFQARAQPWPVPASGRCRASARARRDRRTLIASTCSSRR